MNTELIYPSSLTEALSGGVLINATLLAREMGFKLPVFITPACWDKWVSVPNELRSCQDQEGRLWDILWMLRHELSEPEDDPFEARDRKIAICEFGVYVQNAANQNAELVKLNSVWYLADNHEDMVIVVLPEEV